MSRRDVLAKLIADRFGGNQADFARDIARSPSVVWQYLSGHREMGEKMARHIEQRLRLSPGWMDHPHGPDASAALPQGAPTGAAPILVWDSPEDLPADSYAFIPRRRISLSAGNGNLLFEEESAPALPFAAAWLRRVGLRPTNAVLVYAQGNSMEPTLHDGDMLLVDLSAREVRDGEIYALRYRGELRVKRLYRLHDGGLLLRSDNHDRYPDEIVPPGHCDHDTPVSILGRVLWRGGGL